MIADLRKEKICELLKRNTAVTTASLAEGFGVSLETVRKDLLCLEKAGKLIRVHGGAVSKSVSLPYMNLSARMEHMKREKHEISELASRFVKNGDIIAVDTGSTAREFIDVFTDKFDELTIVTHSMEIFEKASACRGFNVILCGGYYMKTENSFYGEPALEMLDGFHVSKAFIFPAALSIKNGICDCQPQLAAMQKKIMSVSDEVIVAADSSKYEKSALIKVSDMNPSYTYITDSGISEEIRKIYKDNDIRLITGEKGK